MEKFNKDDVTSAYQTLMAEAGTKVGEKEAKAQIDGVLVAIMNTLAKAKDAEPNNKKVRARLQLVNFGSFELRAVDERAHKNPQDPNAEPKIKPAHNKVVLGIGKVFEETVN